MGKGFGIASLVFAILFIFMPIPINVIIGVISLISATLAALAQDRVFVFSSWAITLVTIVFLSPATQLIILGSAEAGEGTIVPFLLTLVVFALPPAAVALNAMLKISIGSHTGNVASAQTTVTQYDSGSA